MPSLAPKILVARLSSVLRTSLWLVPGATAVALVALAKVLPIFEDDIHEESTAAWYLFAGQAESARELLSTIATAMMTFTGLVFSITILVLQLASQQFSPRVLRTFLEDRSTQVAMAVFIGTFVYAMALLPEVHGSDAAGGERVPSFSIFLAFALVMLSVAVFIRYIHAMAHSIRAVHVMERVAEDALESIRRGFPHEAVGDDAPPRSLPASTPRVVRSHPQRSGVVAAVDIEALTAIACERDVLVELVPRIGDFVVRGGPLFRIWGAADVDESRLRSAVGLSDERTVQEDAAFAFRQLVDIAERALSPGVNDPTTAVQAIDRLHDLLTALADRAFPRDERLDDAGTIRVVIHRPTWEDFVHLAFDEIRTYGRSSLQVVRRLRAALQDLAAICPPQRRAVLDEELAELDASLSDFTGYTRVRAAIASAHG